MFTLEQFPNKHSQCIGFAEVFGRFSGRYTHLRRQKHQGPQSHTVRVQPVLQECVQGEWLGTLNNLRVCANIYENLFPITLMSFIAFQLHRNFWILLNPLYKLKDPFFTFSSIKKINVINEILFIYHISALKCFHSGYKYFFYTICN